MSCVMFELTMRPLRAVCVTCVRALRCNMPCSFFFERYTSPSTRFFFFGDSAESSRSSVFAMSDEWMNEWMKLLWCYCSPRAQQKARVWERDKLISWIFRGSEFTHNTSRVHQLSTMSSNKKVEDEEVEEEEEEEDVEEGEEDNNEEEEEYEEDDPDVYDDDDDASWLDTDTTLVPPAKKYGYLHLSIFNLLFFFF